MRCIRFIKSIKNYEIDRRYLSQYGFYNGDKSRQLAGDLSPWYKECWKACICSSTIDSLTILKTKQYFIPTSLFFDIIKL